MVWQGWQFKIGEILGMKKSMELLQNTLISFFKEDFNNYQEEYQNSEYESFSFSIGQYNFRNRLAKKTPTKKGYFVVFWEKDINKKNQAFDFKESPDFLIVNVIDNYYKGMFLFPKSELLKRKILRTPQTKGKMAMRVYPLWEHNLNITAEKTQKWQLDYFLDLSGSTVDYNKLEAILKSGEVQGNTDMY